MSNQFDANIISPYDYISDELAQRISMTTSGTAIDTMPQPTVPEQDITYTTDELNQYTSLQSSVSSIQVSYALDRNLIEDNIHHFTYDAENRLTSVTPITPTTGSTKVEFGYDYMSRRTQKQVSTYDGSSWVLETEKSFTYDGWNVIQEETTQDGTTSTEYYVWGPDLSGTLQGAGGIGGLLSKTNSLTSKTYLYTVDANGNVGQLVDASTGTIAAHYEYDPFGKLLVSTGSEADKNVFRFSTKYYDAETGLYYYGYRYYDPVLGRWTNRDPIGEEGGINLYSFVLNNPLLHIDPKGLKLEFIGPDALKQKIYDLIRQVTQEADEMVKKKLQEIEEDPTVCRIRLAYKSKIYISDVEYEEGVDVFIDSFDLQMIDMADIEVLPDNPDEIGPFTKSAVLIHAIVEQWEYQKYGKPFEIAHEEASKVDEALTGWLKSPDQPVYGELADGWITVIPIQKQIEITTTNQLEKTSAETTIEYWLITFKQKGKYLTWEMRKLPNR